MKLQIGDLAPLFKVEDSDGKLIDLSLLKKAFIKFRES